MAVTSAKYITVVPGSNRTIQLGDVVNINNAPSEPLVFVDGCKEDYIAKNTKSKESRTSTTEEFSSQNADAKVKTIVGDASVNFDMALVAKLSGSASWDFSDSSDRISVTKTFRSVESHYVKKLEMHEILPDHFRSHDLSNYTHVVTQITTGKAAIGTFTLESTTDTSHIDVKGKLEAEIKKIPLNANGNLEYSKSDRSFEYNFSAYLACVGSNAGGGISTVENFVEELTKHRNESREDVAVVSCTLTPISHITTLKREGCNVLLDTFREDVLMRIFEIITFRDLLNKPPAMMNDYFTDKDNAARIQVRGKVEEAIRNLKQAFVKNDEEKINALLEESKYMNASDYKSSDDQSFQQFKNAIQKAQAEKKKAADLIDRKKWMKKNFKAKVVIKGGQSSHYLYVSGEKKDEKRTWTYGKLPYEKKDTGFQFEIRGYGKFAGIRSLKSKEWLYAGTIMKDKTRRYVLTFHKYDPISDDDMKWFIHDFGDYVGIKSPKCKEWMYLGNPEGKALTWGGRGDPTDDPDMRFQIEKID